MTTHDAQTVNLGVTNEGEWVAYSTSSPYFYFRAPTQAEALEVADRALSFYFGAGGSFSPAPKRPAPSLTKVTPRATISLPREPVAA